MSPKSPETKGWCTVCVGCHLYGIAEERIDEPPRVFAFSHVLRAQDGQPMNLSFPDCSSPPFLVIIPRLQDGCQLLLERLDELYILYRRALADGVSHNLRQDATTVYLLLGFLCRLCFLVFLLFDLDTLFPLIERHRQQVFVNTIAGSRLWQRDGHDDVLVINALKVVACRYEFIDRPDWESHEAVSAIDIGTVHARNL